MKIILTTLALCTLAAAATAQRSPPVSPGKFGFSISGVQGSAGILCSGFRCGAGALGITRGEKLTITMRSHLGAPWVLLVGLQPLPVCIKVPGIGNLWAGPQIIAAIGTFNQTDRFLRCWGGMVSLPITVPRAARLKDSVTFQAVADNTNMPRFSVPVQVTVTR